tara:strand:- start:378 stop:722 length:345 start_codon:yes stop_codon:yes gene_type:complete
MSESSKINILVNFGFEKDIAERYLKLCNNNVDQTIEFLINSGSVIDSKDEVDTSSISDILFHSNIDSRDIDMTSLVIDKLSKYSSNMDFIKDILDKTDGNFIDSKMLLTQKKSE